jgi:serine/threonine protein phosphatase PrpC
VNPVISRVDLDAGDALLLCTDGLTKHVEDREIADTLRDVTGTEQVVEHLMQTTLERGATDNVTLVASRFA